MSNILWGMGGGTMYWQFGWPGVLLGGLMVGLIWGLMTQKMLLSTNPLLIIVYLSLLGWGINYVSSLDKLFLDILRNLRAILMVWLPLLLVVDAVDGKEKK